MKKKIKRKFEPLTLSQLLAAQTGSLRAPKDVAAKINADDHSELRADMLVNDEQWAEASHTYEGMQHTTWRTQEKLAYCLFQLGKFSQALSLLLSGPKKQSPIAHCLRICCLLEGQPWVPDDVKPQVKQSLTIALSNISQAPLLAFRLLDILYDSGDEDVEQRALWLTQAISVYPNSQWVLSAYARLALVYSFEPLGTVSNRLIEAIDADSNSSFIWLAYTVAFRARTDTVDRLLTTLRNRASPQNNRWLSLAVAEEQFKAGNLNAADQLYSKVEEQGPELICGPDPERYDWGIVALASRGKLAVALSMNDDRLIQQRLVDFEKNIKRIPEEWRFSGCSLVLETSQSFWIGGEIITYEPYFDLLSQRDKVLSLAVTVEMRGFLRLPWANFERDVKGEFTSAGAEQVDLASQELAHPILAEALYEVARQRGEWVAAGEALTRFEVFRESEKEWVGDSIHLGAIDGAKLKHVRDFTKGFRNAVKQLSNQVDLKVAVGFYEKVIRRPLLEHELYKEMLALLNDLKGRGEFDIDFDYGLANHYLGNFDVAKESYWSLAPNMPDAAANNLLQIALAQRSDADIFLLEQLVAEQSTLADEERLQALESLAENIMATRRKLASDPVVVKKSIISEKLSIYPRSVQVSALSELGFEEALTLISLFRVCGDLEQDLSLEPFEASETPFAPSSYYCEGIFGLMGKGLISISPDTSDEAFLVSNNEVEYLFDRIRWAIRPETLDFVKQIEGVAASGQWPDRWFREAPSVISLFAISECLTYMAHCADERRMKAPQGEKTRLTIANVLRDHSVAQAHSLIWMSARNAADYYVRGGVSKPQAANSIVTRLQTMVDRARAEGWDVKNYGRHKASPRSQMSYTLYDMLLKVGERGFRECLTEISLPDGSPVYQEQLLPNQY